MIEKFIQSSETSSGKNNIPGWQMLSNIQAPIYPRTDTPTINSGIKTIMT
jgi:hypothetical protein